MNARSGRCCIQLRQQLQIGGMLLYRSFIGAERPGEGKLIAVSFLFKAMTDVALMSVYSADKFVAIVFGGQNRESFAQRIRKELVNLGVALRPCLDFRRATPVGGWLRRL